jgi:hypothetical protein
LCNVECGGFAGTHEWLILWWICVEYEEKNRIFTGNLWDFKGKIRGQEKYTV